MDHRLLFGALGEPGPVPVCSWGVLTSQESRAAYRRVAVAVLKGRD